ncbi:unnamed protein product [Schistocephalus solidus]|uniref:Protein kinase domain-containing protein n=1 Tax=Schistocephalus solidus TaxID=70667 RepID=A0A183SQN2_SCHSO|nr:unnamed protein product [Schistocephalus solidus]
MRGQEECVLETGYLYCPVCGRPWSLEASSSVINREPAETPRIPLESTGQLTSASSTRKTPEAAETAMPHATLGPQEEQRDGGTCQPLATSSHCSTAAAAAAVAVCTAASSASSSPAPTSASSTASYLRSALTTTMTTVITPPPMTTPMAAAPVVAAPVSTPATHASPTNIPLLCQKNGWAAWVSAFSEEVVPEIQAYTPDEVLALKGNGDGGVLIDPQSSVGFLRLGCIWTLRKYPVVVGSVRPSELSTDRLLDDCVRPAFAHVVLLHLLPPMAGRRNNCFLPGTASLSPKRRLLKHLKELIFCGYSRKADVALGIASPYWRVRQSALRQVGKITICRLLMSRQQPPSPPAGLPEEDYQCHSPVSTLGPESLRMAFRLIQHLLSDPADEVFLAALCAFREILGYLICLDSETQAALQRAISPVLRRLLIFVGGYLLPGNLPINCHILQPSNVVTSVAGVAAAESSMTQSAQDNLSAQESAAPAPPADARRRANLALATLVEFAKGQEGEMSIGRDTSNVNMNQNLNPLHSPDPNSDFDPNLNPKRSPYSHPYLKPKFPELGAKPHALRTVPVPVS